MGRARNQAIFIKANQWRFLDIDQWRYHLIGKRLSDGQQGTHERREGLTGHPITLLVEVGIQIPVSIRDNHTVKLQTFGCVYGHDVDGILAFGIAHSQLILLLIPKLEEFPHTAAIAL